MTSAKTTKKAKGLVAEKKAVPYKNISEKTPAKKKRVAKKVASKKTPEMVSYSIKMVIPTGEYSNIQPEIIVKAKNPEEAHAYIAPHMNKLWKEYFQITKRRVEPKTDESTSNTTAKTEVKTPQPAPQPAQPAPASEPSPVSSVAMTKATQAVQSCTSMDALKLIIEQISTSMDALKLIIEQIKNSVKLTEQDKLDLSKLIYNKEQELTFEEIGEEDKNKENHA